MTYSKHFFDLSSKHSCLNTGCFGTWCLFQIHGICRFDLRFLKMWQLDYFTRPRPRFKSVILRIRTVFPLMLTVGNVWSTAVYEWFTAVAFLCPKSQRIWELILLGLLLISLSFRQFILQLEILWLLCSCSIPGGHRTLS